VGHPRLGVGRTLLSGAFDFHFVLAIKIFLRAPASGITEPGVLLLMLRVT